MFHTNTLAVIKATPGTARALQIARSDAAFQRFLDQALGLEGDRV